MNTNLKKITYLASKFTFILLVFSTCNLQAAEKQRYTIGFFNPHENENVTFWELMEGGMQAACNDLGMNLKIYHSNYLGQVRQLEQAAKNKEIDAALFKPLNHNGLKLLEVTEQYQIPSIIINVSLTPENLQKAGGAPRQHYKSWIGELLADDQQSGYMLAEGLVKLARQKKMADQEGKIHLVGIAGRQGDGSAVSRNKGFERFFKQLENADIIVHQVVHADWLKNKAKAKFLGLKKRYPNLSVVWSANDTMALGVIDGINSLNLEAGKDIITASIDWSFKGIDAVQRGDLEFSLGGPLMEGGWASVLLYDYLHGIDFAESEGINLRSEYMSLDADSVTKYKQRFGNKDWDKIDFRQLSKILNPTLKHYSFSMQTIFDQLESQENK